MKNKKKTGSLVSRKTFTVIISIAIALFLWAYVIGEVNPTIKQPLLNVPVQLLNIQSLHARDLAIAGSEQYTVDVVVEGKRSYILKADPEDILAEADLFGWSKGENYIPVNVLVPDNLRIIEIRPAKIQVNIEDLVAVSRPVVVVYTGDLPGNAEEGAVDIKPAEIEVTGAKSDVEEVARVQAAIDVTGLTDEGKTMQAEVIPVNYAGMPVESVRLSANYADIFAKLYRLKEVPFEARFTGELEEGLGLEADVQKTIVIKGSKSALKEISAVSTEPVDISGITKAGNVELVPILPKGIELAKGYENPKARLSIVEVENKVFRFSADDIMIEGLDAGKSAAINAGVLEVTLIGRKDIIASIEKEQVMLFVNLAEMGPGTRNVKVAASCDVELKQISVDPKEVTVIIKSVE
jgi:YbbR domain-containing protein